MLTQAEKAEEYRRLREEVTDQVRVMPLQEATPDSGSKYLRRIYGKDGQSTTVDVYDVLEAFGVTCPARAHAVKKLLCSGQRGKNNTVADLQETVTAVQRAVTLQVQRETLQKTPQ